MADLAELAAKGRYFWSVTGTSTPADVRLSNKELLLRGLPWWVMSRYLQVGRQRSTELASVPVDWRLRCTRGLGLATIRSAPAEFQSR
jgi:hypothetical protein